ncbi:biotin transporter BioY [Nocardioides sp. JQ2195]|uniref:biotin transporter BioY n=1 Tax=Nocardioides sp. JQ2195 TaxID=2592334 RepID=UPI00143ED0FA|nr:biotin transporter BioY [Nocardioides sp. JQ2195]QIX26153.1 biotin transporter BioY [Nocardioides sp. JQ2195]
MTTQSLPREGRARTTAPTTDIALIAAFAALISACAYIGAIPVGAAGVPITLQTFAVMLTGCLLGPVRGFLSVALYLGLGAIGLPVFAEHSGGLGSFTGASAGYLWSFPIAALVGGFLVKYVARQRRTRALLVFLCSAAASVLVIHPMGIAGMKLYFDITWHEAMTYDLPFWLGDFVKTTLVALIAAEVHRAFPRLLERG